MSEYICLGSDGLLATSCIVSNSTEKRGGERARKRGAAAGEWAAWVFWDEDGKPKPDLRARDSASFSQVRECCRAYGQAGGREGTRKG